MSIDDERRRIDAIDDEILELLDERARLARSIGKAKGRSGLSMHDPERERQVIARLEARLHTKNGVFPTPGVRAVYREVMSACLSLEQTLVIAYLGPPGTFTHMAAQSAFGLSPRYVEATTIRAVFDSVERGHAAYGVAPIENSSEGSVSATLDELARGNLMIRGELSMDIDHCLVGRIADLARIERVYSHPQALAQCRAWLAESLPRAQLVVAPSTSAAAREAAEDDQSAAVASRLAAELAGLDVLVEGIQDRTHNVTRFAVLAQSDAPASGRDKTSILFSVRHEQGALRRVLERLEAAGINLTHIESRPATEQLWEYVFFTDFEGHRTDDNIAEALRGLGELAGMVRVLGSYPRAD
jgi:chorismate mutase/prephenate dehydratase